MRKYLLFLGMGVVVSFSFVPAANSTYTQEKVAMVLIPAGEFTMGSDEFFGEGPVHKVYLDAFYIDKYEVTNEQFCQFLNEKGNQTEGGVRWLDISGSNIEYQGGKYKPEAGYEDHPVISLTWHGANAYAKWRGCCLPTEAEWEKSARGGLVGKTYPWGDDIVDPGRANYGQCPEDTTTSVGDYSPNGYGLYDMAGNVWEWCSDWYEGNYYWESPYRNPPGPEDGQARVVRGGGWSGPVHVLAKYLGCSYRYFLRPESTNNEIGFRCAKEAQ